MKELEVKVANNYLENNFASQTVSRAILELVWNALDADATNVDIVFENNSLDGLSLITVSDNGHGIDYNKINDSFGFLGSSAKASIDKTPNGRFYHGKNGQGRYFSFSLGTEVSWGSIYKEKDNKKKVFKIQGSSNGSLQKFKLSDKPVDSTEHTGVVVKIENLFKERFDKKFSIEELRNDLISNLGLYLETYNSENIKISLNGDEIDIKKAIIKKQKQSIPVIDEDLNIDLTLEVIFYHWESKGIKKRIFANSKGMPLYDDGVTGTNLKDFGHSIVIKSVYFDKFSEDNAFLLFKTNPVFSKIESAIDLKMSDFILTVKQEKAKSKIDEIKKSEDYPYQNPPESKLEVAERQIFDIVAAKTLEKSPEIFGQGKTKTMVLNLIKNAVENGSDQLIHILEGVVTLEKSEIDDFSELLKRNSLSNIIKLSKKITERIKMAEEIHSLISSNDTKKKVLERKHLHPIIENELWIFGDQYENGLMTSDQIFKDVLKSHIKELGRDDLHVVDEEENSKQRPDICIGKQFPQTRQDSFHHLVVELKRPSVTITNKEVGQIENYAVKVSEDDRFDKSTTTWEFLLIGDVLDATVKKKANQKNKEPGLLWESDDGNVRVIVKSWETIFRGLKWKHAFMKKDLDNFNQSPEKLEFIKSKYGHLFNGEI